MKATITSATEVYQDGTQDVVFDVTEGDKVLVTHSLRVDVEQVKDEMKNFLREYKKKANSSKRVKVGDFVEL